MAFASFYKLHLHRLNTLVSINQLATNIAIIKIIERYPCEIAAKACSTRGLEGFPHDTHSSSNTFI